MNTKKTPRPLARDLQPKGIKDIKDQASRLRRELKETVQISHGQALELVSKMHAFEGWGQANALLSAVYPDSPAPKGPWMVPDNYRFETSRVSACSHAVLHLIEDDEAGDLWHPITHTANKMRHTIRGIQICHDGRGSCDWENALSKFSRHLRGPVDADECRTVLDLLAKNHIQAPGQKIKNQGPFALALPWVDGDRRLLDLLPVLTANNFFIMVHVLPAQEGDAVDLEGRRALLDACAIWAATPDAVIDTGDPKTSFANEGDETLYRIAPWAA